MKTVVTARHRSTSSWSVSSGSAPCQPRCRRRSQAPAMRAVPAVAVVNVVLGATMAQPAAAAAALKPTAGMQRRQAAAARFSVRAAVSTDVRLAAEAKQVSKEMAALPVTPAGHRSTQVTSLHRAHSWDPFGVACSVLVSKQYAVCTIALLTLNGPQILPAALW